MFVYIFSKDKNESKIRVLSEALQPELRSRLGGPLFATAPGAELK